VTSATASFTRPRPFPTEAEAAGEFWPNPVWAEEAIDLISDTRPAADLVFDLAATAAATLARLQT
jgi:hypothetical protein